MTQSWLLLDKLFYEKKRCQFKVRNAECTLARRKRENTKTGVWQAPRVALTSQATLYRKRIQAVYNQLHLAGWGVLTVKSDTPSQRRNLIQVFKPTKYTNPLTFPSAAEEIKRDIALMPPIWEQNLASFLWYQCIPVTNVFGECVWWLCLLTKNSSVSRVASSLWWEDKLNSIPLHHLARMKPNFPRDLTSDELGSYAKEQTTSQLARAESEHNIM